MHFSNFKITSGVNGFVNKNEKFKTNSVSLCINIPIEESTVTMAAIIPMVLKRGTKKLKSLDEISKYLRNMYGASLKCMAKKVGDSQLIYFSCVSIRDSIALENIFEKTISLLKDVLLDPFLVNDVFSKDYVLQEKENLKKLILSVKNDKKAYVEKRCTEIMFKDDPFGLHEYGFSAEVDKINEKNLFEFYKKIISENVVDIFLNGYFEEEKLIELVKKMFSDLKPRNTKRTKTKICFRENENKNIITEALDLNQSKICIGVSCNSFPEELYALMVTDAIIGNSYYSKLFLNIREKLSLAYYVFSKIDILKRHMIISAGIEKSKFEVVCDEINAQIENVRNGGFTEKDIEYAKKHLKTKFDLVEDSQLALEGFYYKQILFGDEIVTPKEFSKRILNVTKDEILNSAKKLKLDTIFFLKEKKGG